MNNLQAYSQAARYMTITAKIFDGERLEAYITK